MNKCPVVKLVCCERSVRLDIEPIYAARVDGGGEINWSAPSGHQPRVLGALGRPGLCVRGVSLHMKNR